MLDDRASMQPPSGAGRSGPTDGPIKVIWPLLGRHIAFHRRLVALTSTVKSALLLSQAIYWTRHGRDIQENKGWFWKTSDQWERETGLSGKEQATARDRLRDLSLLEEVRLGVPARLHFRLRLDTLAVQLSDALQVELDDVSPGNRMMLVRLLGPSLAYHRSLAALSGGVHAGLMLSRALHLTRHELKRETQVWIGNSAAQWFHDVGLTRREQQSARRDLQNLGVWEEALRGIPPGMVARIRLDCLLSLLTARAGTQSGASGTTDQGRRNSTDKAAPFDETRMWHSHRHVLPKAQNQFSGKRHPSFAESAILLINRTTEDLLQPQVDPDAPSGNEALLPVAGSGDLVFPEQLLPEEQLAARALLQDCPTYAQALLDELAGRLKIRGVRSGPLTYLRGLVRRAAVGQFVPELGHRIAAERRVRQTVIEQRQGRALDAPASTSNSARSDPNTDREARRETARHHLEHMRRRLRPGRPDVAGNP